MSDAGRSLDRTIDSLDAAMLATINRDGRIRLVDGDDKEIMPETEKKLIAFLDNFAKSFT